MASEALKRRMAKLERVLTPDDGEPLVIFLNRVDASMPGGESSVCMAVIAGTPKRQGETLRRNSDETAEAFTARVERRCNELHGVVEVEFRD